MKTIYGALIVFSLATPLAFAGNVPTTCPSAKELRAVKLQLADMVELQKPRNGTNANGFPYHEKGVWTVNSLKSNFSTPYTWTLTLKDVDADFAAEALPQLQAQVSELHYLYGPTNEWSVYYTCTYQSQSGVASITYRNLPN